jgi:peptide/nickel transport system permease protein
MPAILKYLLRRLLTIPITLLIVTASLYALLLLAPPRERALLYMPDNLSPRVTEEDIERMIQRIIKTRHLDDPFPVQYAIWVGGLVKGDWGFSPLTKKPVLPALLARVPTTAELAIYSVLAFIPLGLLAGVVTARRARSPADNAFRAAAFVATSLPPFILGLILLAVFYVGLGWFAPLRLGIDSNALVNSPQFRTLTGLLTIDGLLNGRPDITLDALRHLVLPVVTLSLSHWATLGRLTRASVRDELDRLYITSARARGLSANRVVWKHAVRNALVPALNSTALSTASLVTGVFVVESIFGLHGMSELITTSLTSTPDLFMAVGFAVLSVLLVLPLMFILDVAQAIIDPRIREGIVGE